MDRYTSRSYGDGVTVIKENGKFLCETSGSRDASKILYALKNTAEPEERKYAMQLADEYKVGRYAEDFFNYIIDSYVDNHYGKLERLFNEMVDIDQEIFINRWLDLTKETSVNIQKICIRELFKRL